MLAINKGLQRSVLFFVLLPIVLFALGSGLNEEQGGFYVTPVPPFFLLLEKSTHPIGIRNWDFANRCDDQWHVHFGKTLILTFPP